MRTKWVLMVCLFAVSISKAQQTPSPILFFTDIIAGPASGNSDTTYGSSGGAYVTLYGNFLDNFTSVKLNNASCLTVVSNPTAWLWYERMVVKLGTTCTSGNFSITTASGTWNGPTVATANSVTLMGWSGADFTVTSGAIHYVSPSGNDNNAGTFSAPWQHAYKALDTDGTSHGNVDYFMAGTFTGDNDDWGAIITPRPEYSMGTATQPNAMVGYPGVTAQIGQNGAGSEGGIRCVDTDAWQVSNRGYWTFAELAIRAGNSGGVPINIAGGAQTPGYVSQGFRLVALDVSSAQSTGGTPFQMNLTSRGQLLGNWAHDLVLLSTSRLDQAMYMSTDSNYIDIGWNEIYNNAGRGGLQTHSSNLCYPGCYNSDTTGFILHDLWIHDNKIHHINEEGILLDTIDPKQGNGVRVYNNLIYDAGRDGSGDTTHSQLSGDYTSSNSYYTNNGLPNPDYGQSPAPAWWYNNTIYASGGNGAWGNWWPDVHVSGQTMTSRLANNIFVTSSSTVPYLDLETYMGQNCTDSWSGCGPASGSSNLFYGGGALGFPTLFSNSVSSNPGFVNAGGFDFHLSSSSSPAVGAGLQKITDHTGGYSVPAPTYDFDGRVRPNPPSLGAYEYGSATTTAPNPPTGLTATVN
jgi:hypothetical protein